MQYAINVLGAGDDAVFSKTRLQLVKALEEVTQACVYSFYIYITVV